MEDYKYISTILRTQAESKLVRDLFDKARYSVAMTDDGVFWIVVDSYDYLTERYEKMIVKAVKKLFPNAKYLYELPMA